MLKSHTFRLAGAAGRACSTRSLHASSAQFVKTGDSVPSVTLYEDAPSNTVDLAAETKSGKYVIIGVPGAFSPGCSASHVPGYWNNFSKLADKGVKGVYVVAVNDSFVTGAWKKALEESVGKSNPGLRFLADHDGAFSKKWDLLFDASKFFGTERTKRYAAVVEDGKVVAAFVEPDSTGISVSTADAVLKNL